MKEVFSLLIVLSVTVFVGSSVVAAGTIGALAPPNMPKQSKTAEAPCANFRIANCVFLVLNMSVPP
ncbi:hypothetical protein HMPREF0891_1073 [Lactobacillus crispatus 214-1]|nr:hypothetical protein HMPREF0891_1073 [Lactobacillus crispatus 214-1]